MATGDRDPAQPESDEPVGAFDHRPVMVDEVVALLSPSPPGVLLDATLGGAGHARALLDAAPHLTLLGHRPGSGRGGRGVQGPGALRTPGPGGAVPLRSAPRVLEALGVAGVSAALFDLGVSSPQLDRPERGFSYRHDGPLDMRMDPGPPVSASDVVNGWSRGRPRPAVSRPRREPASPPGSPERWSPPGRSSRPLALAEVVRQAIPAAARRTGGHPARRVFQAVRVAVNEELDILPGAIDAALAALVPGGRCAVISYHSGEDRIAKERFRLAVTGGCVCPPGCPASAGPFRPPAW